MANIRETCRSDFGSIRQILSETKLVEGWFTPELFDRMLRRNPGLFLVAEEDGIVVGTLFASHDGGYFGYIYKVAVTHDHRRGGVASMLVERAIENFKRVGIEWIFANVHCENEPSFRLLAKFGLTPHLDYPLVDSDPK